MSNSDGNIHAVIAAFYVWMIVVARDQQDVVVIAVRVRTQDGNFSEIVNLDRFSKLPGAEPCRISARKRAFFLSCCKISTEEE